MPKESRKSLMMTMTMKDFKMVRAGAVENSGLRVVVVVMKLFFSGLQNEKVERSVHYSLNYRLKLMALPL